MNGVYTIQWHSVAFGEMIALKFSGQTVYTLDIQWVGNGASDGPETN